MSLLERRRALLAAGQEKEGGGENDGKYIYMICRSGANTNCWSASVDYGVNFQGNTTTAVRRFYRCSNAFDCNGNLFYQGINTAYSGSYLPLSAVTAPSQITSRSFVLFQGYQPANSSRAWFWSTDGKQCIRFSTAEYTDTYGTTNSLQLWDNYGPTPIAPKLSLNSFLTVPIEARTSGFMDNASGPYLKFNSDTLQVGFIAQQGRNASGFGYVTSCSFTRDGGQTWTSEKDIVVDNSQSLGTYGFVSAHMSNDGKHIGFVHQDSTGTNTLYVSHDYGSTFNSIDTSMLNGNILNFETSAKFKTWYLSTTTGAGLAFTASIWKSVDQGQSWTKIRNFQARSRDRIYELYHCNDAGDKLVTVEASGSTSNSNAYAYYSHDGGQTWGYTGLVNYPTHGSWNFWMSRDSHNTGKKAIICSMSLANVKSNLAYTLERLFNSGLADEDNHVVGAITHSYDGGETVLIDDILKQNSNSTSSFTFVGDSRITTIRRISDTSYANPSAWFETYEVSSSFWSDGGDFSIKYTYGDSSNNVERLRSSAAYYIAGKLVDRMVYTTAVYFSSSLK